MKGMDFIISPEIDWIVSLLFFKEDGFGVK